METRVDLRRAKTTTTLPKFHQQTRLTKLNNKDTQSAVVPANSDMWTRSIFVKNQLYSKSKTTVPNLPHCALPPSWDSCHYHGHHPASADIRQVQDNQDQFCCSYPPLTSSPRLASLKEWIRWPAQLPYPSATELGTSVSTPLCLRDFWWRDLWTTYWQLSMTWP